MSPRRAVSHWLLFLAFWSGAALGSCKSGSVVRPEGSPEEPFIPLTPYQSPTASPTAMEIQTNSIITATAAPTLTATPVIYRVIQGDTMLAIALRFGIRLEELLAANPEVNPSLMPVGTELIIPSSETTVAIFATPTPMALAIQPAACYEEAPGGVWCFILVKNNQSRSIENVAARVSLQEEDGTVIATGEATSPLNIIRVGEALPLMVYFPSQAGRRFATVVELVSALPVPLRDGRYLNAEVEIEGVHYDSEGRYAVISGEVRLPMTSEPARLVWLAAVGYGKDDRVVAVRKFELSEPLEPGTSVSFELEMFSLGPEIERVEVLVESRP